MRMSGSLKWFLVSALLLAATIFVFIRISNALDDYQRQMEQQLSPQPQQSQPQSRPWLRDQLIRT